MSSILNDPVLVLNKNWQPVAFLPLRIVVCTLMRNTACAIHPETYELLSFENWMERAPEGVRQIKTSSRPFPAPEVIVMKNYGDRPPRQINFNRMNLYRRDAYSCQYCGSPMSIQRLTIDHVLPKSKGGRTSWENCVAACRACNQKKSDRTPLEARMRPKTPPRPPVWVPKIQVPDMVYPSWIPFLERENVA